jgi:TATA-binding protein-associated factor
MPSTPLSATLINLWQFEEAPWKWPKWQKLTGVHHGLFPLDDAHLPDGWTRQDATEIRSYFNRVLAIRSVEDRTKLHNSRAGVIPGREKWKNWLKLVQRKWKLHTIVVEGFKETNVNPNDIYSVDPSEWPDARSYIPLALASVGLTLFGSESLDAVGHLSSRLRPSVTAIAQLTWSMLRVQNKRANCKLSIVEALAVKAFEGLYSATLSS